MRRLALIVLIAVSPSLFAQKMLSDAVKDLAAQISAHATKEQKKRVAVIPFQELDGQSTVLGTYIAEELLSHLVNSGLKIVERGMLDKILAEQKLQRTGAIDEKTAKQIGKIAGVDAIVTGSIADLQSNVGVNCRLIDTTTGDIFGAAQVKIAKDDDVKKIM
ncbi:MAG TPA: FlgO family outer membrane protein, partial [Thermoanaerobaculia bacterium]